MLDLYHNECLNIMSDLDSSSIDLTVTSPPYDKLRTYNDTCDWSFNIFKPIATELFRLTKQGGVVVWIVGDATIKGSETGSSFRQALYFKEIGFNLHDTMIYRTTKPPLTHNRYEQEFDFMFIFTKGKPKTVNHIKIPCTYAGEKRTSTMQHDDTGKRSALHNPGITAKEKIKGNIWFFNSGKGKGTLDAIAFNHPATFPEQLAHDHIISWSNQGDTVLDPFMGSGTTGKISVKLDRNFIGIERVQAYYDIAVNRIEQAKKRL